MKRFYHRPVFVKANREAWQATLSDRSTSPHPSLIEAIIPLLDGSRSLEEIFGQLLIDGFEVGAIFFALDWLESEGLIEESPDSNLRVLSDAEKERYAEQIKAFGALAQAEDTVLSPLPTAGVAAQVALKQSLVVVAGLGGAGSALIRLLSCAGVGRIIGMNVRTHGEDEDNERASIRSLPGTNPFVEVIWIERVEDLPKTLSENEPNLFIYCPDQFDHELCEGLNQICLSGSIPLLPYRSSTFEVAIGPLVIPHETACYICYHLRRKGALLGWESQNDNNSSDQHRLSFPLGVDWLALEALKLLTNVSEPVTRGRLLQINILSGLMELHPVLKLPRCPACGVHKNHPPLKLWEE